MIENEITERPPGKPAAGGHSALAVVALVLLPALVFAGILGHGFVAYDDDAQIYADPILNPPTVAGLAHVWHAPYQGLYIPVVYTVWWLLSWMARMPAQFVTDVGSQVSLMPWVFHAASLVLHVVNVLLVYRLLRRVTGADWPSALGALVFGLHPVQVESVAWASELRGVLCGTFSLLSLLAYHRSADRRSGDAAVSGTDYRYYGAAAICLALALLSKPSAAPLPIVALVLDRVTCGLSWSASLRRALPLLVLPIAVAVVTRQAQPVPAAIALTWLERLCVSADTFAWYAAKILVPIGLTPDYGRSPGQVIASIWSRPLWLVTPIAAAGLLAWRRRPAWLTVAVVVPAALILPVSGIVPFNFQFWSTVADRYLYLPMLGPALGIAMFLTGRPRAFPVAAGALILVYGGLSWVQTGYWKSTDTLMGRAVSIVPRSALGLNYRAAMVLQTDPAAAVDLYRKALAGSPMNPELRDHYGVCLLSAGQVDEGINQIRWAIRYGPASVFAHENLARAYAIQGKSADALAELATAESIDPTASAVPIQRGALLLSSGHPADAVTSFARAVRLDPQSSRAHLGLAASLMQAGDTRRALTEAQRALALDPASQPAEQLVDALMGSNRQ
ncbi:MAG: tetratricopeptide repeat protein [Capsulimonadaceae bacterium]